MTLTARLALATSLLVTVAVSAVGWLNYHGLQQILLPRILDQTEAHARLVAFDLQSYLRGARADIASLRAGVASKGFMRAHLAGGIDPVDGVSEQTWRGRIVERLFAELRAKPAYAQFRMIGIENSGREIIRVDRSGPGGAIRLVPEAELQKKGDRAYFRDTLTLGPDDIYVSDLDLNEERGVVETPHLPSLRVATQLLGPDDKPFGIIIINVDMRPAFDRVRSSAQQGGEIYAVNQRGDYLVHPDPTREFGTQLGRPTKWTADFPRLALSIGSMQSTAILAPDQSGRLGGRTLAPALLAGKEWVGIIETIPNAILAAPATAIQHTSLLVGLIAVLCAAALAMFVARSLTLPIVQLTAAVEGIGHSNPVAIPVDAGGETGVLARAFARVMDEVNAKTAELEREISEHRHTEAARDHHAARERIFSAAVESSNDSIITYSLDGEITGWNPAAERLFGYNAAETVGQKISIVVPPDRSDEPRDMLRRTARGETVEPFETVRMRRDGGAVEISLSVSPIKDPSGTIIGVSTTARDITESRRTQQALRWQIEERRRIFETSQDLVLIVDSAGTLVQVSPSSEAILGYMPEEMVGHNASEFLYPDDLDISRAEMRRARRGLPAQNTDSRYVHKDGRVVALSWMGTWSEPVRRFFFVGRDMTESRLAQEILRENEQLARRVVDTALDAFFQSDERGNILNCNWQAENIFGWPREEMLGKNMFELIYATGEREELKAALERFLRSGANEITRGRREVTAVRHDETEFKAELSITALKTRDGFVFNTFARDLTDKIATEERIRQAEKMEAVGQLTGGIAHDFNNILTVITGTIEYLAKAVEKEPQLAAIAKMIDEAASRGANLTQHLLAFARKQPLQPQQIDVNRLILDTLKLLRPTLGERIEIESVFGDETCVATVDPNQLVTAVLNLALNARDAMPDGGKLVLETGPAFLDENYARLHNDVRPGPYVLIAVSDTGTGIPADILDRVFDPFFTSKEPGKGTGLGLSMVYGFVKQSAGHISIYSEESHGTTIKMYLPPGTEAVAPSDVTSSSTIQGGHETILVVEDDELVRNYVLAQLHSLGYSTLSAGNAAEALDIIAAGHEFDLLFTDVIMPGAMNGRQLATEIQKGRPDLKVLFTSGYTENAIIHHGRLDSGVTLLAKPYRKSEMARVIRKTLAG